MARITIIITFSGLTDNVMNEAQTKLNIVLVRGFPETSKISEIVPTLWQRFMPIGQNVDLSKICVVSICV